MRRAAVVLLVAAVAAVAGLTPPSAADVEVNVGEEDDDSEGLTVGQWGAPVTYEEFNTCTASAYVWAWEHGDSGVNRIAIEFQLRAPQQNVYIPGLAGETAGWWWSPELPLDDKSYYGEFVLPLDYITWEAGTRHALWLKAVGERDSFWQRDIVRTLRLGEVACDGTTGRPPPATRQEVVNDISLGT